MLLGRQGDSAEEKAVELPEVQKKEKEGAKEAVGVEAVEEEAEEVEVAVMEEDAEVGKAFRKNSSQEDAHRSDHCVLFSVADHCVLVFVAGHASCICWNHRACGPWTLAGAKCLPM